MSILHFLLTPDRSSARRVRRIVAENSSRLGVMVGTWTELVEAARKAYVLPDPDDSWNEKLTGAAAAMTDAFWAKSLEVAREESLSVISSHLAILIEGAGPQGKVTPDAKKVLPDRARKHLTDLTKLNEAMAGALACTAYRDRGYSKYRQVCFHPDDRSLSDRRSAKTLSVAEGTD